MGITESTLIDEKFCGFRVYKIIPGGPLDQSGIKELEDFIIPPADLCLHKQPFYEYIRINSGKKLNLNVYSLTTRTFSDFEITPGINEKGQGYLGATVRYENWNTADKNVLRVLRVREDSIAKKKLGLIPLDDFIVAIRPDDEDIISLNKDNNDPLTYFSEILSANKFKPVEFFIYNQKQGARYEKVILDGHNNEVLGCDVAYGKLHEFPKSNKRDHNQRNINHEATEKTTEQKIINNISDQTVNDSCIDIDKIDRQQDLNDQEGDIKYKENPSNNFKTELDVNNTEEIEKNKEDDILVEEVNEKKN